MLVGANPQGETAQTGEQNLYRSAEGCGWRASSCWSGKLVRAGEAKRLPKLEGELSAT